MANKIYTIGREFGSGGREVGEKLAAKLGIKLYDKELLQQAAKDSGFCEEIFENHDEKPTNSFFIFFSYGYIFCQWLFCSTVFGYAIKSQSFSGAV